MFSWCVQASDDINGRHACWNSALHGFYIKVKYRNKGRRFTASAQTLNGRCKAKHIRKKGWNDLQKQELNELFEIIHVQAINDTNVHIYWNSTQHGVNYKGKYRAPFYGLQTNTYPHLQSKSHTYTTSKQINVSAKTGVECVRNHTSTGKQGKWHKYMLKFLTAWNQALTYSDTF